MSYYSEYQARTNKLLLAQTDLEKSNESIVEALQRNGYLSLEFLSNYDKQREIERLQTQDIINNISLELKSKLLLIQNESILIKDYEKFKKEMVDLQYNIYKLKNNARLNINYLEKQYEELLEDVEYYTTKSEEWGQSIKFVDTSSLLREKKSSVKKLTNKEVRQFLQFVHESGGHENGWNKQDHQVFLKLYSKYAKLDVVAKHVHEILPDITTDEIVCHAEWYKKYLNLKKNQERALLHWKNSKTKIKNVNHNHKIQTQIRSQPILEEDIQAKLQQWKADKESQLLQQIMQEKLEEQKKQELEEKKRKQYNEIKKYIQEWKSNKNEVEEKAKLEKMQIEEHEKRRRAFIANKMIKSFQSQDDMYVMKMKQLQENMKKKPIRSKSSSIGRRDPSRLLKPTEQWIHRVHNDNDQELCNNFLEMPLNCIPKLRIPDWRK